MLSCQQVNNEIMPTVHEEELIEDEIAINLTYMGRASVRIDISDGRVIYIDPYAGSASQYEDLADLVLVTHQHSDHNVISKTKLKEEGIKISCPFDIKAGDIVEYGDIKIQAVSAYNSYHTASSSCGFVITIGDIVIYHSGDTSTTDQMPEMKELTIDYALLCMDGFYNMGPEEAMTVSDLIGAQAVIPIHTSGDYSYNSNNAKAYTNDNRIIVNPGETLRLYDLSTSDGIASKFEDVIEEIIENKNEAIQYKDMKKYMKDISNLGNGFYYNEQERWFDEMTSDSISNVDLVLTSYEMIDKRSGVAYIAQSHIRDDVVEFVYPILFKYQDGRWMDQGYYFKEYKTDRFVVKHMEGEEKLEDFVKMLDDAYDNLSELYPLAPIEDYEMKLFNDQELLRQRTIPTNPWVFTGWSEPDESLKLYTGQNYSYESYAGVVQHELVHHITLRMCKNNLPIWLVEGIAMYDGSAAYGFESSRLLSSMTKSSVSHTIESLESNDLYSRESFRDIASFYNTSYMYVKYITEVYGRDQMVKLFQVAGRKSWHFSAHDDEFEIKNRQTADEVLKQVLSLSKEELSKAYLVWLDDQSF